MVLATDGQSSYVGFIYADLQWEAQNVNIGFRFDGNSTTPNVLNDTGTLTSRSNIFQDGFYLFQVNDVLIEPPGT